MYKETKLFKRYNYPSWSLAPRVGENGQIIKHKDTSATNWDKYIFDCHSCSLEGSGYQLHTYKRGQGIKKVVAPYSRKLIQENAVEDFKKGLIQYGLNHGFIR